MKKFVLVLTVIGLLLTAAACGTPQTPETTQPTVTEAPTQPTTEPVPETTQPVTPPTVDLSDKAVFHIQTDTITDDAGRWLVDFGVGKFQVATEDDVSFLDSKGWFSGSALSMKAKPNADYNLFWQVDPEGQYCVDTGLDPETAKLTIWIYVEDVEAFYKSSWTEVDLGTGSWFGDEWVHWQLKDEWINQGWNYLEFKLSEADENTGLDLAKLRWFRFCFVGAPEGMEFRIGDINLISDKPA